MARSANLSAARGLGCIFPRCWETLINQPHFFVRLALLLTSLLILSSSQTLCRILIIFSQSAFPQASHCRALSFLRALGGVYGCIPRFSGRNGRPLSVLSLSSEPSSRGFAYRIHVLLLQSRPHPAPITWASSLIPSLCPSSPFRHSNTCESM